MPTPTVTRRGLLQGALFGSAAALLAACTSTDTAGSSTTPTDATAPSTSGTPTSMTDTSKNRTLLAYFSRPGENYWNGGRRDLDVGNTEVLATMISGLISCDVFRIEAADSYSADYDDTVARNVREQDADARPAIASPLPSLETLAPDANVLDGLAVRGEQVADAQADVERWLRDAGLLA